MHPSNSGGVIMVEETIERNLDSSELVLSIIIGALTILMISSSAGPAIVKPLLLDGSLLILLCSPHLLELCMLVCLNSQIHMLAL